MLASSVQLKAKYEQSVTPVTYSKNHLKPPSRKLWGKESSNSALQGDHWNKCTNSNKWDLVESPQFIDFTNAPNITDSFFDKVTVVVSTPNVNFENGKLPNTIGEEDTLVASFNDFSLSGIKYDGPTEVVKPNKEDEKTKERYVVHKSSVKMGKDKNVERNKIKKSQNTAINPFNFEMRNKCTQQRKQERINKILEEEKKMTIFRANPLPKYLKSRPKVNNNNQNNNKNNNNDINNGKVRSNTNEKVNKISSSVKQAWKKSLTVSHLPKKNSGRPKTPPLQTAVRAQQRKHFDDTIREKERQRERLKQMEIAAREKQEQEELLRLRKQTIHKAQPIRKYKLGLPIIEKRPLTDPVSPISLKRRRRNA